MTEATARRVLHVVDVGSLDGGAQRLVLDLILNLRGAGWEPVLACPEGELLDRVSSTGISAHAVNFDARLSVEKKKKGGSFQLMPSTSTLGFPFERFGD